MTNSNEQLIKVINENKKFIEPVIKFNNQKDFSVFDLSVDNKELYDFDITDTNEFANYISSKLDSKKKKIIGIGGYGEDRLIYKKSKHFDGEGEARSIHLGIDIWINEGTPVYCPLSGVIHSFKNNNTFGDYGPTIIIEHLLEGITFYTLYGHLSIESIESLTEKQMIRKGDEIGRIGSPLVNGNWPAHLHFQLITDMLNKKGDFYGVAPPSEKEQYYNLCLNPNLILQIDNLS
ncbi:MAG: peptidoglycan DD-metalloendopeptidase family protein [Bacteroidales bacterium]|jgi:murein DD-endopeptidase MepM/ murein hydrolase activator NlpD|nr:peptidoglycan DD-metalloendopeptidase family protein [Bacteroidales bacterium]